MWYVAAYSGMPSEIDLTMSCRSERLAQYRNSPSLPPPRKATNPTFTKQLLQPKARSSTTSSLHKSARYIAKTASKTASFRQ